MGFKLRSTNCIGLRGRHKKWLSEATQSYRKLKKYGMMVRQANLGTTPKLLVDRIDITHNPMFKKFFLYIELMKQGFKNGCRPFIGMDGCHPKGPYGGVLLFAMSLDGNNGLFPVVFALVEVENTNSWSWFLELLELCVGDRNSNKPFTLMTNKQNVKSTCHKILLFYLDIIDAYDIVLMCSEFRSCHLRGCSIYTT